ncbi:MAG: bifunctional phosphopantothenoylcysteine decarboxylase/phosphopantothenate--cysteine ligase CoaBC [Deltaproteobacteria bacterium]|nr:bifunctional phosphopantothenoylcysteine decarboxylase/phosphopantothenate--cysteine ligase CoaBC [Deltaproteobacteria bacterium]
MQNLKGKIIVLGIGGGIAAYKSCELVRLLVKGGAGVHVVMTAAAKEFVTPLTLQTLSMNPVSTDFFDLTQESQISHIALADRADLVVIAPATADLIAKAANGLANDLLTNILLATRAPVLFCPSMNVHMWEHKATQANVKRIKELGYQMMEPDSGDLACGYEGKGRLCEPKAIVENISTFLK